MKPPADKPHEDRPAVRGETVAPKSSSRLGEAWQLLKITCLEWWKDDAFRLAASLAFYTIFSIAPILLIAVGVAGFFFTRETASARIAGEVQRMVGADGAQAVRQVIEASKGLGSGVWAVTVGIGTLIVGATAVFGELQNALNKLWDVESEPKRGLIMKLVMDRARSFAIALGVGFLLLVSLVFSAVISGVQDSLTQWMPSLPWLWQTANIGASFLVAALLFAMIYRFLPDVRLGWKDVWVGAAATALLFTVGKYLIGLYLGRTAVASAFGAAGSFVVLLFWVYYSALISFLGAEFTQVYARRHGAGIRPLKHARRLGNKPDRV
jgi:membrane protein